MRVVDDPELLEQVSDDVGRRRFGLDVQHLDRVARKVERRQSSGKNEPRHLINIDFCLRPSAKDQGIP